VFHVKKLNLRLFQQNIKFLKCRKICKNYNTLRSLSARDPKGGSGPPTKSNCKTSLHVMWAANPKVDGSNPDGSEFSCTFIFRLVQKHLRVVFVRQIMACKGGVVFRVA